MAWKRAVTAQESRLPRLNESDKVLRFIRPGGRLLLRASENHKADRAGKAVQATDSARSPLSILNAAAAPPRELERRTL